MFGSKRNKLEEQIKEIFSRIKEQRDDFESRVSSIEEGGKRVYADVSQVMDNTKDLADYAMQNVEAESALIHQMDDVSKDLKLAIDEYNQLAELLKQHHEAVINLVEENKHYTTPSKYLTETPAAMRHKFVSYETKIDELAENGRKMSVMALNAAIEAGRMGDVGKQFVAASEEIRQTALGYEREALSMKEEFQDAQAKINELEEVIFRLVSLIKDGNIGTNRLLKKSMELNKRIENSSMRDFSEDVVVMRDKVVAMRNLDEEISKSGERNKIQLGDIQEELQLQKNNLRELESDLFHILDEAQAKVH